MLNRIQKILCPVDFSRLSEKAVASAAFFAGIYKANLHLVHVIPPVTSILAFAGDTGDLVKTAHEKSQLRLEKMARSLKSSGLGVSTEVRFGEIDDQILKAIGQVKADLVVTGTQGRRGFQHWLIGSVAERLLRRVPVPMLTVGRVRKPAGAAKIKRILIGVDFSAGSREAASFGFSIAEQSQANVTLLHVTDFVMGDIPPQYRSSLLDGIRRELQNWIPLDAANWSEVTSRVEFGIPYQRLIKLAAREKADLIVLGTQGGGRLQRALLGSNAERVIRGASCPVLAVPAKSGKKTGRAGV